MSDAEDRELAEELTTAVTRAAMRELMLWRRGIKSDVLVGVSGTLPLVIEEAVYRRLNLPLPSGETDIPPYEEDERVEVWDALAGGWRAARVLNPGDSDNPGVLVKVSRIYQPVWVPSNLVRRPLRPLREMRGRVGAHYDD